MHIKDQTAEKLYNAWELDSKDKDDILQALAEAYMQGCLDGGIDSSLRDEAIDLFSTN